MIKIKGKKLPPEETHTEYTLPEKDNLWHCSSHQIIFEPGDKVLINGKSELKCPLEGCKKHSLTCASRGWWKENYILEKWEQTYTPFQTKKKTMLERFLSINKK